MVLVREEEVDGEEGVRGRRVGWGCKHSEPKKHGGAAITGQEATPNAPRAKTVRGKTALTVPLS
jgi:hypothetical protein